MKEYETEEIEPADCEPSEIYSYWRKKASRWPRLSAMVKDLLSVPATSAASERSFSTGKDVFGISRMSLDPQTLEALVCLRSWYRAGIIKDLKIHPSEFIEDGDKS